MSVLFVLLLSLRELLIFVHLYHLKVQVDTHNSATVHVHAVYCMHALQLYLPAIRSALTNDIIIMGYVYIRDVLQRRA